MKQAKQAHLKKDPAKSWYHFSSFERRGAKAAFSTRRFQTAFSDHLTDSLVIAHRKHFCKLVGVPFDGLVTMEQMHSANIARVNSKDRGRGARNPADALRATDGAVTNDKSVVLSIRSADCAPVFFFDPVHQAIGMAHVGWRGAHERLASKMVQAFKLQFLSKPKELVVAIGPMIRSCCYEVGSEFRDVFGSFVAKKKSKYFFDLTRWIINDVVHEGVLRKRVYDSGLCTHCLKADFPSYRRDGKKTGFILSILKLHD